MTDLERALGQISDVRAQMAASTRFRGLAPEAVASSALLAFGAAAVQTVMASQLNGTSRTYVAFWVVIAVMAVTAIGWEALGRARRLHGAMADGMLNSALRLLLPALGVGAIVTFVVWRNAPEALWLMPGLWQLLIGVAGFSALPMLSPEMRWAGFWYIVSGTISLIVADPAAPLSPWLMGIPFAVGQLMVAAILWRANEIARG